MHGVKRFKLSQELRDQKLAKDKIKIQSYNHLQDIVLNNKLDSIYNEKTLEQTTVLLDLNPEFYTIWNYRRDILVTLYPALDIEEYNRELQFTMKQMLKYPKCYWIWNHRKWCLKRIHNELVFANELEIVNKMLSRDERNFHGWAYRRYVIEFLEEFKTSIEDKLELSISEFSYTTKMINKNISNYSAWHNRSKLIIKVFELQQSTTGTTQSLFQDKQKFLANEIEYLINAMFIDSEDSSIWIYIRWVITTDFFYDGQTSKLELLEKLKTTVIELNELEKDDNDNKDNEWCLKTINLIQSSSI